MAKKTDYNPSDDDFEFGDIKTDDKSESSETKEKTDESKDQTGSEEEKELKESEDKETEKKESEKKEPEKKEPEKKGPEKKEPEKKEEKETKEQEEEEEEDEGDIFLEKKKEGEETGKISLKKLAKDLDVDLEKDDEEEFKTKFSDKLAKSRKEFNLDGYSDGAKAVIKHLNENGGDLDSFFLNKQIASMQSVLALDAETKVRNVRIGEVMSEGKTETEAAKAVDEELKELSTREIKDLASDIDDQAKKLINKEVTKIIGDQEIKIAAARQKQEQESILSRTNLKSFIEKQNNFLGLTLTTEAKKLILRDIDNGTFDRVLKDNPEQLKFASYMYSKYGNKIMKKISNTIAEQSRKGFNEATRKHLDTLHKVGDVEGSKSGHESSRKDSKAGSDKPGWKEEDL